MLLNRHVNFCRTIFYGKNSFAPFLTTICLTLHVIIHDDLLEMKSYKDEKIERIFPLENGFILWPGPNHIRTIKQVLMAHQHLFVEVVPGRDSIAVLSTSKTRDQLFYLVLDLMEDFSIQEDDAINPRQHLLPIQYDWDGEDVLGLCKLLSIDQESLFEIHASCTFTVDFFGFLPGFPYMSGLAEALQVPRKSRATNSVKAGSVAIANDMCGIYPQDSPGGWHVIGHIEEPVFDAHLQPPSYIFPGDSVNFIP